MVGGLNERFDARNNEVLERLDIDVPTARAEKIDSIDATVSSRATQASVDAVKSDAEAIKAKTDALPADPSSQSAVEAAILAAVSAAVDALRGDDDVDHTHLMDEVKDANSHRPTTFGRLEDGAPVALLDATFVKVYDSGVLTKDVSIWGVTIDITLGSPTNPAYKITNAGGAVKRYPFGASKAIKDNKTEEWHAPCNFTSGEEFEIWVHCDVANGASATVTAVDRVEVG